MIVLLIPIHEGELSEARGIATIDINQAIILVKDSVEKVASTLLNMRNFNVWQKDVYNQAITVHKSATYVFQLKGHSWSIILEAGERLRREFLTEEDTKIISETLQAKSFYYIGSDSADKAEYSLFNDGLLLEKLYLEGEIISFESSLRNLAEIAVDRHSIPHFILVEQDAYVPAIKVLDSRSNDPDYYHKLTLGEDPTLLFMNLLPEQVERMDYLAEKEE